MNIKTIKVKDLRSMTDTEGIIIQGCGGDLERWVEGINEELTAGHILQEGSLFEDVATFKHKGLICLFFPLRGVKVDMQKLAIWRIKMRIIYGAMWLSDFIQNSRKKKVANEN